MGDEAEVDRAALRLRGVVLGTPDPVALAASYARLLGWAYRSERRSGWCCATRPGERD